MNRGPFVFIFVLCVVFNTHILGQCLPTPGADECALAPLISTTGMFCGNTGNYTPDTPNWLNKNPVFGNYTVENSLYYKFVANSNTIQFKFCSTNCNNGFVGGSQFLIFSGVCGGPASKVFLIPQIYQGSGNCSTQLGSGYSQTLIAPYKGSGVNANKAKEVNGCLQIKVNGFTIGQTYYIMIDGFEGSVCDINLEFDSGIVLPVELVLFKGYSKQKESIINWTTASETNNDYFLLEASSDGKNFHTKGRYDGAGNSNHLINYSAIDKNPESLFTFYRLKQVDYDGTFTYSKLIRVNSASQMSIQIAPNPALDKTTLYFDSDTEDNFSITFNHVSGREAKMTVPVTKGVNEIPVNLADGLADGFYLVTVRNSTSEIVYTTKFIKGGYLK